VCGLLLIPILRLPTASIAVTGAVLIVYSYLGVIPIHLPTMESFQAQAAAATRVYAEGSFVQILAFRWRETNNFIVPLLLLTLPRTLGVILLGVAAWRSNLLTTHRNFWAPILLVSGTIGIVGTALHSDLAAHVPLAFAYAAAVLLWIPRAPLLAAGGQMALTNYLTQSVVFSLVFYGFGLGYFGRLGVASTTAAGLAFYLVQLVFSRWWLLRFHFGPAEWLWRSLTYGRRQPFLRGSQLTLTHAGARVVAVGISLFAVPLIHGGIPWILGVRGPHWGWTPARSPGIVNYLGLLSAGGALALLVWILVTTLSEIHLLPERSALSLRPARLLKTGPYAWSRHPLYVAEILLWLGVACYLGSPVVMAVIVAGAVFVVTIVIPREEHALETYFGDEYREYRQRVPVLTYLKPPRRAS
jgi:protein-S-isoprenylcysteine O-methyltransferase Ste14